MAPRPCTSPKSRMAQSRDHKEAHSLGPELVECRSKLTVGQPSQDDGFENANHSIRLQCYQGNKPACRRSFSPLK